ncbi:MAG: oxidoreductase [Bacteroidia bacterium]
METRTAMVLGASGLVGSYVLQHLLENNIYEKVIALVRKPLDISHKKLRQEVVDFEHLRKHANLFKVDDLYCCVGTTIKKAGSKEAFRAVDYHIPIEAAKYASAQGVKQYLLVSSLGANAKSTFFYMRTKGELEEDLKKHPFRAIHIFHPSMLLGPRKENRFGEKIGQIFMKLVEPLLINGLRKYKAIHAETVAKAMIKVALDGKEGIYTHVSDEIERIGK